MTHKINIYAFAEQFKKEYQFLYHHDNVPGYDEALEQFDAFAAENPDFVREFVNFRGDYISSDREAAAFAFALEAVEVEQKPEYQAEKMGEYLTRYRFENPNRNGERLAVDVVECRPDLKDKNSLTNLWKKYGYTSDVLENFYSVTTYATDAAGNCRGRYNPQHRPGPDGGRPVIDFAWLLPVSAENLEKLLTECRRLFSEG